MFISLCCAYVRYSMPSADKNTISTLPPNHSWQSKVHLYLNLVKYRPVVIAVHFPGELFMLILITFRYLYYYQRNDDGNDR